MKTYNKVCATCNNTFISKRSHTKFCSRLCHRRFPENKLKYNAKTLEYQKLHSREPSRRFEKLRHRCNHEQKELLLLKEEYIELISKPCHYCGNTLINETGVGLDRIDNSMGHIIDNVVPCCGACNQVRNIHLTHSEMKVAMNAVVEYRKMLGEL